jgi:hypothetical protein
MTPGITICCLKKGDRYRSYYVHILEAMVRRNVVSTPYEFVCFTDDNREIAPYIRTAPLLYDAPKWWGKMGLYMKAIPGINTERLLYLDLDLVITGQLDELLQYEVDFAMAKDFPLGKYPKGSLRDRMGNSSVICLKVGAVSQIWDWYCLAGKPENEPFGDQDWVNKEFPDLIKTLPERFVRSYKLHYLEGTIPPKCSIVMFHGHPKPPDCGGWVKELWK